MPVADKRLAKRNAEDAPLHAIGKDGVELHVKMPLQWTTTIDTGKTRVIEAGPSHSTSHMGTKANMKMLKERMVARSKLLAVDHLNQQLRDSKIQRERRRSQNATSK